MSASVAAPSPSPAGHEDRSAFGLLMVGSLFFVVSGLIALIIAAKFHFPTLLGSVSWLTFGRLRPIHTNGMLFGWLLAADMGLCFYLVPRLCGVRLWSEKLGPRHRCGSGCVIILGAVVDARPRPQPGARVRRAAAVARRARGGGLGDVRGQHLRHRLHPQVPADVRLALVHPGLDPVDRLRLHRRATSPPMPTTGVNQANLNWFYVHNAVGPRSSPRSASPSATTSSPRRRRRRSTPTGSR